MFALARTLRERGVLSLNRRNAEYVLPYNPRRLYHLVDDKLETKRLAQKLGLPVPTLYGVIRYAGEVSGFAKVVADHKSFAIKPSQGAGGDGIIVITGRSKQLYRSAGGKLYSESDLHYHLQNTLSGIYSLGGQPDKVLIE
jgi:alpha-L-glutamate ligase-like protein